MKDEGRREVCYYSQSLSLDLYSASHVAEDGVQGEPLDWSKPQIVGWALPTRIDPSAFPALMGSAHPTEKFNANVLT